MTEQRSPWINWALWKPEFYITDNTMPGPDEAPVDYDGPGIIIYWLGFLFEIRVGKERP